MAEQLHKPIRTTFNQLGIRSYCTSFKQVGYLAGGKEKTVPLLQLNWAREGTSVLGHHELLLMKSTALLTMSNQGKVKANTQEVVVLLAHLSTWCQSGGAGPNRWLSGIQNSQHLAQHEYHSTLRGEKMQKAHNAFKGLVLCMVLFTQG